MKRHYIQHPLPYFSSVMRLPHKAAPYKVLPLPVTFASIFGCQPPVYQPGNWKDTSLKRCYACVEWDVRPTDSAHSQLTTLTVKL